MREPPDHSRSARVWSSLPGPRCSVSTPDSIFRTRTSSSTSRRVRGCVPDGDAGHRVDGTCGLAHLASKAVRQRYFHMHATSFGTAAPLQRNRSPFDLNCTTRSCPQTANSTRMLIRIGSYARHSTIGCWRSTRVLPWRSWWGSLHHMLRCSIPSVAQRRDLSTITAASTADRPSQPPAPQCLSAVLPGRGLAHMDAAFSARQRSDSRSPGYGIAPPRLHTRKGRTGWRLIASAQAVTFRHRRGGCPLYVQRPLPGILPHRDSPSQRRQAVHPSFRRS